MKLSRKQDGPRLRCSKGWTILGIFLTALVSNVISLALFGAWDQPPRKGDGLEYDNIALNLVRGRGFGYFLDDPEYREPYFQDSDSDRHRLPDADRTGRSRSYGLTARRPPAFPFALAVIYRVFGRDFLIWRLLNCAIIAVAVALAAAFAWRVAAAFPAMAVGVVGVCDPLLKRNAGYFLTDGPACLGVILLAWSLVLLLERKKMIYVALCGVTLAALLLLRSIFVLWYPSVLVLVVWCWTRLVPSCQPKRATTGAAVGVFMAVALLLPLPWWVRNCVVLDAVMPLGTQGGMGLPGGYSDTAVRADGIWIDPHTWGCFDPLYDQMRGRRLSAIELERAQARFGTRAVLVWIDRNPHLLVGLAMSKLVTLWTHRPKIYFPLLLGLGCLGLRWTCRRPAAVIPWALVACNSLAIMVTYTTRSGRFQVPVLLLLHVMAAIGLWRLSQWLNRRRELGFE